MAVRITIELIDGRYFVYVEGAGRWGRFDSSEQAWAAAADMQRSYGGRIDDLTTRNTKPASPR